MIFASARQVDEQFIATIPAALQLIAPSAVNLVQRIALLNGARFTRATADEAASFAIDYLRSEHAHLSAENEPFAAEYVVELDPPSNLVIIIKLSSPGRIGSSGYGCSVRRVGEADYIVDEHSPVFAANWRWMFR